MAVESDAGGGGGLDWGKGVDAQNTRRLGNSKVKLSRYLLSRYSNNTAKRHSGR